ncbi:MAG: 50S ribosomal protein L5 [Methanobacteriota archaeon]|nr:MAG: 50S ribosomal protein L5 [Euryarchaeota archaeon]
MTAKKENPMRRLMISKVVVNMGVGESGERLAKAEALLEQLTGQRPVRTYSKSTIKPFGIRKGEPIGCKVTLFNEKKEDFLKKAFEAVDNRLKVSSFDERGNFSFGIREHIDIEGMKYDPNVGIFGMDVCASIERPGYRVQRRKVRSTRISKHHQVKREEAMEFVRSRYKVEITAPEEEE